MAAQRQLGLLLAFSWFLQFKEFELYWGAVFLRLEEEYWRSPSFFNQFYGVIFEAGNETRERI